MKAVYLSGSPRDGGNTDAIAAQVIRALNGHGVEVRRYSLHRADIGYCCGCTSCKVTGDCVFDDDVAQIVDAIFSSRLVIVGSPSYWGDVTGQMKVFIDRCTPYCNTNVARHPIPTGIKGVAIAVRAGGGKQENRNLVHTIEHFLGHLDIPLVSSFTAEGIDSREDLEKAPSILSDAFAFGEKVYPLL